MSVLLILDFRTLASVYLPQMVSILPKPKVHAGSHALAACMLLHVRRWISLYTDCKADVISLTLWSWWGGVKC